MNHQLPKPQKGRRQASLLILALRRIARSKEGSIKVRLEACKCLMAVDPSVNFNAGFQAPKPNVNKSLEALLNQVDQQGSK